MSPITWGRVESGQTVRELTYAGVERALGWPEDAAVAYLSHRTPPTPEDAVEEEPSARISQVRFEVPAPQPEVEPPGGWRNERERALWDRLKGRASWERALSVILAVRALEDDELADAITTDLAQDKQGEQDEQGDRPSKTA